MKLLVLYALLLYIANSFLNIFTLWLWADVAKGGLEFNQAEIGYVILAGMILFLIMFKLFYKFITNRYGGLNPLFISLLACTGLITGASFINLVENYYIRWALLILADAFVAFSIFVGDACGSFLLNNSLPKRDAGYINGWGNFVSMLSAMIGFFVNGIIFAWSTNF